MKQSVPQILIVEDDMILAMTEAQMLRNLGYEVLESVSSGDEALDILERETPDAILMDIKLEGSMDGVELTRRVNEMGTIPVIYVSAYSKFEDCETTNSYDYLMKPIKFGELKHSLGKLFAV